MAFHVDQVQFVEDWRAIRTICARTGAPGGKEVEEERRDFFAELWVVGILLRGRCPRRGSFDSSAAADSLRMKVGIESFCCELALRCAINALAAVSRRALLAF